MLELKNINVIINNNKILEDISFVLDTNFLILFGESGSGKSTLLNTILGSQKSSSGKILLNGKDITNTKIIDRNIGILFQDLVLFPNLSIIENINIGKNKDLVLRDHLINKLKIKKLLNKMPNEVSGGEAQRVAFIRTIITKPKVLLLDEPFSGLDKINKDIIQKELKDIIEELKIPTIIVTHDKNDIEFFGGNYLLLK